MGWIVFICFLTHHISLASSVAANSNAPRDAPQGFSGKVSSHFIVSFFFRAFWVFVAAWFSLTSTHFNFAGATNICLNVESQEKHRPQLTTNKVLHENIVYFFLEKPNSSWCVDITAIMLRPLSPWLVSFQTKIELHLRFTATTRVISKFCH